MNTLSRLFLTALLAVALIFLPLESHAQTPVDSDHWAYQKLTQPEIPAPDNTSWAASPIDRFISVQWKNQNLKPVGDANKRTLIRRATYDVTGLPPHA